MDKNNTDQNKNIIVGPDYGQMIKQQTNGAIVEAFLALLFSKDTKFGTNTIVIIMRNMAIILLIKVMLEESKAYFDKFRFTNLNSFRYAYQWYRCGQKKYEIILVGGKWTYNDKTISIATLSPFLESKLIYLNQPATYYFQYQSHLIKVIISTNQIIFCVPDIDAAKRYMDNEIIHKNQEILFGGKTTMSKVMVTSSNILKLEPVQLAYAFATENYNILAASIKNNFLVDSILKFPSIPFCVNFDGDPGTGKTTFASFIAGQGIFTRVIIFNLVQSSTMNFQEIVLSLERQMNNTGIKDKDKKIDEENETVLIIFDEMDKWLESYINHKIHALREDARGKKEIKKDEASAPVMIQSYEKLNENEEKEKRTQIKNDFLDQLYKLVDGHILPDIRKYVIIFNTNNFDSIFNGTDKRYDALRDRFQIYRFSKNGKKEVITYLKSVTDKLRNYYNEPTLKHQRDIYGESVSKLINYDYTILERIPADICISYRSLLKILRTNCFSIEKTVDELCKKVVVE